MENDVLITMANQITDFWSPYPKTEATESIARHIHTFWDPRMRDQMKAIIDDGAEGLSPLFVETMKDYFNGPKSPAKASPASGAQAKPKAGSPAS